MRIFVAGAAGVPGWRTGFRVGLGSSEATRAV